MKTPLEPFPDNPYLLLTPGPLTTTRTVKAAMLQDWSTWDDDYHAVVQDVRRRLVRLAASRDGYTCVLMQGSGTFSVEAVLGTALPPDGRLLVVSNGAYGLRMAEIARYLNIPAVTLDFGECSPPDVESVTACLNDDPSITHVAAVHCETTTGMLNPVREIGATARAFGKVFILDAMSSFGGVPLDLADLGADFMVSSANKCIQGVPGFGFVVARRAALEACAGRARSLSLDLYDQWRVMEEHGGKWRFTSPTHTVRAFHRALDELDEEGGVAARHRRYSDNHRTLVDGMRGLGYACLLPDDLQSPIITTFHEPDGGSFDFASFYTALKGRGFVIYPGKITRARTFRIGTIGNVFPEDMGRLVEAVAGRPGV